LIPGDQEKILGNTTSLGSYELSNTSQRTYTLKYWYAVQVWNTAIAIISRHIVGNELLYILPHWEDRDDSFRKLVNDEKFAPNMVGKLWELLEDIANSGNIKVHEGFFMENITKAWRGVPSKYFEIMECRFCINIILDVVSVCNRTFPIKNIWEYEFNKDDKSYKWDEIKHLFCEVSLSVRELLNHEWMNRMGEYDEELMKACFNLDIDGVKRAVEKGANVNALNDMDETPLTRVVDACRDRFAYDDYTEAEREWVDNEYYHKQLPIIDYLLEQGADINLFGYNGDSPLVAAYYTRSIRLVEYLLKRGANPNVNCHLTDSTDEVVYCSSILSHIDYDYDDYKVEIESIVKQYGGRLYYFGYNPIKREYSGRAFVLFHPTQNSLFCDSAYDDCGDSQALHIEISENEYINIDISIVEGLENWHQEFINHFYNNTSNKSDEECRDWFDRGLELAQKVKLLLPDNVDLYYLSNSTPLFQIRSDGSKQWTYYNGEHILVE
jgi:ankyrin repeat protein